MRIKEFSPATAGQWYEGLLKAIFSLENFPERCPIALESDDIGKELRQLLYGKRGRVYKIFFSIMRDEVTGEDVVRIYRIWYSARQSIAASNIAEGESQEF